MNKKTKNILKRTDTIACQVLEFLLKAGEVTLDFYIDFVTYRYGGKPRRQSVYNSFSRLQNRGYIIKAGDKPGKAVYKLAEPVRKEFLAFNKLKLKKRLDKKWDGKWRLVPFDIPETKKKHRDMLRRRLKNLGLELFQQSIWLTPYSLSEDFYAVIEEAGLENYVEIIETDHLPKQDLWIRKFNLRMPNKR